MNIKKFTVSNDRDIYEAWPDVVQTKNGNLICVFTECKHHLDRAESRLALCYSSDRGRTWSEKRYLTEKGSAEDHFNCARISMMQDGRLAVICDRVIGPKSSYSCKTYLWFGDEDGNNWQDPVILPFDGIVPDKLLQLQNGRIIISNHKKNPVTQKLEQYLWYSDDNGNTWSERIILASDSRYNLCEVSIVECENNMLVAFLRENSRIGLPLLKTISYDNGNTWSELYMTTIDCGHRPVAGFLQDGTVMITYRYIPVGTQNVFAAFMNKDSLGKTTRREQRVRIMPLDYDRNPSPDLGYTGWTQFEDGEIYVVNYIKDDCDTAHIRGYSFYPCDVVLPVTENTTKNDF